jgi:hypothetical protein
MFVFVGAFAFYFLPGLLMPALSNFSVITWFAPNNVVIANLVSTLSVLDVYILIGTVWHLIRARIVSRDLRLGADCIHWVAIGCSFLGSTEYYRRPGCGHVVHGTADVYASSIARQVFDADIVTDYANVMYSAYMPILSAAVFDNRGKPYDVSKILTDNFLFDETAYQNYSRVFLPITYVLSYALQFAALTALISHTALWHGKDILRQWRRSYAEIRRQKGTDYEPLPVSADSNGAVSPRAYRASTSSEPDPFPGIS